MTMHRMNKIFALLLMISISLLFTSCQIKGNVIGLSDYHYEDSEKYIAGEAELTEMVENIDISWMVGSVTILSHNLSTVCISEKSDRELTEDLQLRYWLDDTTLRIKFCSCGKWNLSELEKELTVLVPAELVINNLKVDTLSSDVKLSNCSVAQLVKVNTLSGKVEADFSEQLNEFKGNSTSGSFTVSAPTISRFDVGTVSGRVSLSVKKEPDWLDIDITSGDINLALPESASFTLDYDTTSGDISSELSYRRSAGKYIFGDGKGEYKIASTSADVRITANK